LRAADRFARHPLLQRVFVQHAFDVAMTGVAATPGTTAFGDAADGTQIIFHDRGMHFVGLYAEAMTQRSRLTGVRIGCGKVHGGNFRRQVNWESHSAVEVEIQSQLVTELYRLFDLLQVLPNDFFGCVPKIVIGMSEYAGKIEPQISQINADFLRKPGSIFQRNHFCKNILTRCFYAWI